MTDVRRRRRGITAAMYKFLRERGSEATIAEITAGIADEFPNPASSSVRGCLQNEKYFVRIQRGVFRAIE